MPLNMTRAGERSEHLCSSQSPEILFLLTLPFIERASACRADQLSDGLKLVGNEVRGDY